MSGTIWAVVVAGGTGSRLGLPYNKVFAGLVRVRGAHPHLARAFRKPVL